MKLRKLLVTLVTLAASVTVANAALDNSSFVGGDNGVSVIDKANGMQFDLNEGTTNLNWNKFNVGANEVVDYNFNFANSTAINQIDALGGVSTIAGQINAIGKGASSSNIIINNAAGVSFVNGSLVNVGAMTVNADSPISVQGLNVKKGDLFLNSTKGGITVNGLLFNQHGNLFMKANDGNIILAAIKKADTINAETNKNIYIKGDEYKVGNVAISGITTDYLQLASTKNGEIGIENAKITVGRDFIALTNGRILDDASSYTGSDVHTVITKHGEVQCAGYGGRGSLKIANAEIKQSNGSFKIFAGKTNIENSKLDTFDAETVATVKNSTISKDAHIKWGGLVADDSTFNELNVAMNPGYQDNCDATLNNSTVKTVRQEGKSLYLNNTRVTNLSTTNTSVKAKADAINNKSLIENAELGGGELVATNYKVNNVKTYFAGVHFDNVKAKKLELSGSGVSFRNSAIDSLEVANTSSLLFENSWFGSDVQLGWVGNTTIKNQKNITFVGGAFNGTLDVQNSTVKMNNLKVIKDVTLNNAFVTATKVNFDKNISQVGGGLTLNNSIAKAIDARTGVGYASGSLTLNDSTVTDLNTTTLYSVDMVNSKVKNNAVVNTNWLNLKNSQLALNNSTIGGTVLMSEGSSLIADAVKVNNCVEAKNSKLVMNNSSIGHHLILDDSNYNIGNTKVFQNIYLTSSANNDITSADIQPLVDSWKGWNNKLYVGYAPEMGNYNGLPVSLGQNYSGNINLNVDMGGKNLFLATNADINAAIKNTTGLTIDNANNVTVVADGKLKLNDVIAKNIIDITADALETTALATIDSKASTINLNVVNLEKTGSDFDANGREYSLYNSNGQYRVYDIAAPVVPVTPVTPVVPETSVTPVAPVAPVVDSTQSGTTVATQYQTTLDNHITAVKNVQNYELNPSGSTLAAQFGKNVKSLAADDSNGAKMGILRPLRDGFRVEKSFIPALNK